MCVAAAYSGDDADRKFRINLASGLIETTSSALDRETRALYELVVSVTDNGVPSRMVRTSDPRIWALVPSSF